MNSVQEDDLVALNNDKDATVYRVKAKSKISLYVTPVNGRGGARWIDISLLQVATRRQIDDPHNQEPA